MEFGARETSRERGYPEISESSSTVTRFYQVIGSERVDTAFVIHPKDTCPFHGSGCWLLGVQRSFDIPVLLTPECERKGKQKSLISSGGTRREKNGKIHSTVLSRNFRGRLFLHHIEAVGRLKRNLPIIRAPFLHAL